jgi:phage baseplate assembly protein W
MVGFAPKLPLERSEGTGYSSLTTYKEVINQNFKNLILTSPGERIMDSSFGVGLKRFLFQMNNEQTQGEIRAKIFEQVNQYMPFIEIKEIKFVKGVVDYTTYPTDSLGISIHYKIIPLNVSDYLEVFQILNGTTN